VASRRLAKPFSSAIAIRTGSTRKMRRSAEIITLKMGFRPELSAPQLSRFEAMLHRSSN